MRLFNRVSLFTLSAFQSMMSAFDAIQNHREYAVCLCRCLHYATLADPVDGWREGERALKTMHHLAHFEYFLAYLAYSGLSGVELG